MQDYETAPPVAGIDGDESDDRRAAIEAADDTGMVAQQEALLHVDDVASGVASDE